MASGVRLPARADGEAGFGLVEMLIALTILNVGILALVAAFYSGTVSLRRASSISTASAIADKQMEGYRALRFRSIGLLTGSDVKPCQVETTSTAPCPSGSVACPVGAEPQCQPSQTVTGPDNRTYTLETTIVWDTTSVPGRDLKRVTVVVRDAEGRALFREASSFDASYG